MADPTLPLPDDDEANNPAAGDPMAGKSIAERIENARTMAENLIRCPAGEQYMSHAMMATAQAIRDLCDVVERLDAQPTAPNPKLEDYLHQMLDEMDLGRVRKGRVIIRQRVREAIEGLRNRVADLERRIVHPAELYLAGEIVDFLNGLVAIDRDAVRALMASRVPCNEKLADHPSVQVRAYDMEDKPHDFEVGILGLLNGLVGVDTEGLGLIQLVVDDEDEELLEFRLAPAQ